MTTDSPGVNNSRPLPNRDAEAQNKHVCYNAPASDYISQFEPKTRSKSDENPSIISNHVSSGRQAAHTGAHTRKESHSCGTKPVFSADTFANIIICLLNYTELVHCLCTKP